MSKKNKIQIILDRYLEYKKKNSESENNHDAFWKKTNDKGSQTAKDINNLFSEIKSKDRVLPDEGNFESLFQKVEYGERTSINESFSKKKTNIIPKVAAILLPLAIITSITLYYLNDKGTPSYEIISTIKGSKTKIILEDGTTIWLNSESELKYPSTFKGEDKRVVKLVGEAYFNVAKNEKQPFEVYAAGYKFRVLGTAFNVKAYPNEDKMQTTLEHGKVNVEKIISDKTNESQKIVSLKPKQTIVIYKDKTIEEYSGSDNADSSKTVTDNKKVAEEAIDKSATLFDNEDLSPYIAWKDNKLVFNDVSINDMTHDLERWYNINVVISDEDIKDIKFTATFTTETAEQAIKAICLAAKINYKIDNNTVILKY